MLRCQTTAVGIRISHARPHTEKKIGFYLFLSAALTMKKKKTVTRAEIKLPRCPVSLGLLNRAIVPCANVKAASSRCTLISSVQHQLSFSSSRFLNIHTHKQFFAQFFFLLLFTHLGMKRVMNNRCVLLTAFAQEVRDRVCNNLRKTLSFCKCGMRYCELLLRNWTFLGNNFILEVEEERGVRSHLDRDRKSSLSSSSRLSFNIWPSSGFLSVKCQRLVKEKNHLTERKVKS